MEEYVRNRPLAIEKIYARSNDFDLVQKTFRTFKVTKNDQLSRQSCFAHIKIELKDFDYLTKNLAEKEVIVALDHVQDPRNVGAITRTCAFFGVRFLLAPKDRQALLTQSSVATAQGGFSAVDLVQVTNLKTALEQLKKQDFWIFGSEMNGKSLHTYDLNFKRSVIILGNEETGLKKGVIESCDEILSIPTLRKKIDSLNVSVAAGIFISHFARNLA